MAEVVPYENNSAAEVLRLAAAVESASEHPIAKAIAAAETSVPSVTDFRSDTGFGVTGVVESQLVSVGRLQGDEPQDFADAFHSQEALGKTAVCVRVDSQVVGFITVADSVKDSSAAAIAKLKELGLKPILLSGDNAGAAVAVAQQVGVDKDDVIAGVLPADKINKIRQLQHAGDVVAMVGDGINDAAALAQADLGIAMGAGTDVAIEASDITLMHDDPRGIVDALQLSRRTLGTIKGNLFWAFAYNVLLIPVAAIGLLNPMLAGAAMAFSSVFVVSNSLRLRGFQSS